MKTMKFVRASDPSNSTNCGLIIFEIPLYRRLAAPARGTAPVTTPRPAANLSQDSRARYERRLGRAIQERAPEECEELCVGERIVVCNDRDRSDA